MDMRSSSKFWLGIYCLAVIVLMVVVDPILLLPVLIITFLFMPDMAQRIGYKLEEMIESFNSWLDSKFDK
jgi:hypothetical protein